jgi:hypothetical protein
MKTIGWTQAICGLLLATRWVAADTFAAQEIALTYREVPYAIWQMGAVYFHERVELKRLPDFGPRQVLRGLVDFYGDPTNNAACLWDCAERKLYLDSNRNLDLTDDAEGAIAAVDGSDTEQQFEAVGLKLHTTWGARPCRVVVSLARNGASGRGTIALHSFWEGQVTLGGQPCQVGLVPALTPFRGGTHRDFFVLRPWSERDVAFSLTQGTPAACFFPRRLYHHGAAVAVKGQFTNDSGQEVFRLELQDETPTLGEVKLTGSHVQRLILEDASGYTVVVDQPAAVFRAPTGKYQVSEVWLRQGSAQAVSTSERQVEVRGNGATPLVAGGPLTNAITVKRRHDNLEFDYALRGVDGEAYRLRSEQSDQPPAYIVRLSGRQVATGKFAFG